MIRNNIITAFRNFRKNELFSLINILGLADKTTDFRFKEFISLDAVMDKKSL